MLSRTVPSLAQVGLIGVGKMGEAIAKNLVAAGHSISMFDVNQENLAKIAAEDPANLKASRCVREVAEECSTVVTMLPNDKVLNHVCREEGLVDALASSHDKSLHVSCSTVSPYTSRELSDFHLAASAGSKYVGAPVFARPDGLALKQASFTMSSACPDALSEARTLMEPSNGKVFEFGNDPGAGNVTKLCGNFLIATTIESLAESLALAEANGVDRVAVKDMLTSTIFDCLIYKGYGQRVSERDHQPGGFALELGLKDVGLVLDTAHRSGVPMPFGSVMKDGFTAAMSKGRENLDWSALGLGASENAGVDVSKAVEESAKHLPEVLRPDAIVKAKKN
mmetsp:Transcript_12492/g.24823  ORF Transcript_12492/g.24823 Transcript_12492/m.24823 type:complete len:338 (+) Transcript_12492:66-1079(+)